METLRRLSLGPQDRAEGQEVRREQRRSLPVEEGIRVDKKNIFLKASI